jgi:hypothetical protein
MRFSARWPARAEPGEVHERRGLQQGDVLRADGDVGGLSLLLAAPGSAVAAGQLVDDEVAGVVAGALVGAAGVAEADDDGGPGGPPVSLRSKKERASLRLPVLPFVAFLGGNLVTLGLLTLGFFGRGNLLVGLFLDDAGGLHLLVRDLRRLGNRCGHLFRVGEKLDASGASGRRASGSRSCRGGDVEGDLLRDVPRQGLDLDLVRDLLQHAALLGPGRLADERERDR